MIAHSDYDLMRLVAAPQSTNNHTTALNILLYRACTANRSDLLDFVIDAIADDIVRRCGNEHVHAYGYGHAYGHAHAINLGMLNLFKNGNLSLAERLAPYYTPSAEDVSVAFMHACKSGQLQAAQWIDKYYDVTLEHHRYRHIIRSVQRCGHIAILKWLCELSKFELYHILSIKNNEC